MTDADPRQHAAEITNRGRDPATRRLSRRRFLVSVGAGAAGALAAGTAAPAGARASFGVAGQTASRGDRFGRMFSGLPSFAEATPAVEEALRALGAQGGPLDARDDVRMEPGAPGPLGLILNPGRNEDSSLPAGVTFLGQFVDHDITFDLTSRLGRPTAPEETRNFREPVLNLDSIYGGGYGDTRFVLPDGSMRVERCDANNPRSREDLPRTADGTAVVADPRNDENLMIAATHAAMLLFHNRALETVPDGEPAARFAAAQRLTRWH